MATMMEFKVGFATSLPLSLSIYTSSLLPSGSRPIEIAIVPIGVAGGAFEVFFLVFCPFFFAFCGFCFALGGFPLPVSNAGGAWGSSGEGQAYFRSKVGPWVPCPETSTRVTGVLGGFFSYLGQAGVPRTSGVQRTLVLLTSH